MDFIKDLLNSNIFQSALIILVCFIFYNVIKNILNKSLKHKYTKNKLPAKHVTYIKLFKNIFKYLLLLIAILFILQVNGINVSSLIAGLGIASAIIGLALQDALKDIIMGANILTDNFFMVGDIIKYKDIEGKVISIGLKNTKIQDIYNKNIICITNRNIDQIINVSNLLYLHIPAPYETNIEKVENVLNIACSQIKNYEHINNCRYLGVNEFADSSLIYLLEIDCEPEFKPSSKRAALRCIKVLFDNNNITIPYKQIDIHTKINDYNKKET